MPAAGLLGSVLLLLPLSSACTAPPHPDSWEVAHVVSMYLLADQEGDRRRLRRVLHSRAELWSVGTDGVPQVLTATSYRAPGGRVAGLLPGAPGARIVSVDVHGTAAMVKAEGQGGGGRFTHYLTLLKLEGGWQIVGSSSHWDVGPR